MIRGVYSNFDAFHDVEFRPGLNVVLAERTLESTSKDSRNGVGKSTLIQIIDFCLASDPDKREKLRGEQFQEIEFSLEFEMRGSVIRVSRSPGYPGRVYFDEGPAIWPIEPKEEKGTGRNYLSRDEWSKLLGWGLFDLPIESDERFSPTFRSLLSYMIRKGQGAFLSPFEQNARQFEWDKQVNVGYLLDLNWRHAAQAQRLRVREKEIAALRDAAKTDVGSEYLGNLGTLESARVRTERELDSTRKQLRSFRVHPQYREIEAEANAITFRIRDLTNENVADQRLSELYRQSLTFEQPASDSLVEEVFSEAGVLMPEIVVRTLEESRTFHSQLVENRRAFLQVEVSSLDQRVQVRAADIERLSNRRAELLEVLQSHGALDEYSRLYQLSAQKEVDVRSIDRRIELLRRLETEKSDIRIETERLRLDARSDLEDRRSIWEEAIAFFDANSRALYEEPGELEIDLKEKDPGFRFEVKIDRSGSHGIDRMKIFCFDLALAQLWSSKTVSPGFLIHDSEIFDGVDERQVARSIQLAASESERLGFQYICFLNSDSVPKSEFTPEFDFESYIRLRLADHEVSQRLMGFQF